MNYIALLRGINVGGHKKIKMADLRLLVEGLGFGKVLTYIQSGNIVFKSEVKDPKKLENQISKSILDHYGFEVPVIVKKRVEIERIMSNNPFDDQEDIYSNKIYFVLLKEEPNQELMHLLSLIKFENEQLEITPSCVYLKYSLGAGKAKCSNNLIETKLKVSATSRNYRTMMKLLEMTR